MPEHSVITDPNIHEPKGVSSASDNETYVANGAGSGDWKEPEPKGASAATEGMIYVADGLGSGTWTLLPTGWGHYKDAGAAQIFDTTAAKLSIDGAGVTSESGHLPLEIRGTSELWNTTTDTITPISTGDTYDVRLDLPVTAKSGTPATVIVQLDIGGDVTPTIVIVERDASISRTPPYTLSLGFPIFCLSTFLTNGGQFFLATDTGTVTITNPAITLVRNHSGDI